MIILYIPLPYQILPELKYHEEAEQTEACHQAHHGQGAHIGRVADVQVLSPKEQRPTNDGLKIQYI